MESSVLGVFLSIAVIQIVGWLTPGANLVAVSSAAMSAGRANGVATALGIGLGVGLWSLAAVLGIALVFQAFPILFTGLKIAGAAFLCWLGYKSILAAQKSTSTGLELYEAKMTLSGALRTGFLVLMTNPKAPIFFGAVLTSFLPLDAPIWVYAVIVLQFWVMSSGLNSVTALVFSTRVIVDWFGRNQRTILFVFGLLYIGLGALVIYDAVTG